MSIAGTRRPSTKVRQNGVGQGNYPRKDEDRSFASLIREVVACVLRVELACNRLMESRIGSHGTTRTAMVRILNSKIKDLDRAKKVLLAARKQIDPDFRP